MITISELAKKHGVGRCAVYNWIKKGCPHERRQVSPLRDSVAFFEEEKVEAWLAERRAQMGIATTSQKGGEA